MLRAKKERTYGYFFIALSIGLLILTFSLTLVSLAKNQESANLVALSYHVQEVIQHVYSDMRDAERTQRGYLITGEPTYKTLFQDDIRHLYKTLTELQYLVLDSPQQTRNLTELRRLSQNRIDMLNQVLKEADQFGLTAAKRLILNGQGMRKMQDIQAQIRLMLKEEAQLLVIREKQREQYRKQIYLTSILFFLIAFTPLVAGLVLMRLEIKRSNALFLEKNMYAEQLEQSNQELSLVATIASHDLKAPLRKINFFIEQIQKDPQSHLSPENADFFQRIQSCTEKMQKLIEHVLFISRRQSTDTQLNFEHVNLRQLALDVTATLEPQIRDTNGIVEIGDMCSIHGNKLELAQLLQNLVENGLKYHKPGVAPLIHVFANQTPGGQCEIRVQDNGIGIEREHQKEIFEMFNRSPSQQTIAAGHGIGLGTVSRIVKHHQGSIHVESQPGDGTSFIIGLPSNLKI